MIWKCNLSLMLRKWNILRIQNISVQFKSLVSWEYLPWKLFSLNYLSHTFLVEKHDSCCINFIPSSFKSVECAIIDPNFQIIIGSNSNLFSFVVWRKLSRFPSQVSPTSPIMSQVSDGGRINFILNSAVLAKLKVENTLSSNASCWRAFQLQSLNGKGFLFH